MIVSPKRILWPTDLSTLSLKAADYARGFREIFGAELRVIHVCEPSYSPMFDGGVPLGVQVGPAQPEILSAANQELKRLVDEVFPNEPSLQYEALIGVPWMEICDYARRNSVDMIVIATHGRTGIKRTLLGSVAERVVQHAPCPVLVVKDVERDFTIR